jgi:hypothetical protein
VGVVGCGGSVLEASASDDDKGAIAPTGADERVGAAKEADTAPSSPGASGTQENTSVGGGSGSSAGSVPQP